MSNRVWVAGIALFFATPAAGAQVSALTVVDARTVPTIVVDAANDRTLHLAAQMLGRDIRSLTGVQPAVVEALGSCPRVCILLGAPAAPQVARLAATAGLSLGDLGGQWEVYRRAVLRSGDKRIVLLTGSDTRGIVYGVADLSRQWGVSPWSWWADVTPRRVTRLTVPGGAITSRSPDVKYRGIFLNDEDWGLQPWAARTLEPDKGNIGPRTYAHVFELMWRLKANTIWPAMHAVTAPFFSDAGNVALARDYDVVLSTSHAEPMMRNNLREWDEGVRGAFDYTRNARAIDDYWTSRIDETKGIDSIYTVGLRGIHDGPMQGAADNAARLPILERVIARQRGILAGRLGQPADRIPQVYVAYHELQEVYDAGLRLPDDVTLLWADDNYGYIRQFSSAAEQRRVGGSGVYYHLSYWGRPHDYLWLGTTSPYLIKEELEKAWATDARRMWMVNVGDIKPIEYLTQYFLDLAFDARTLNADPRDHLVAFMREQFGPADADEMAAIMLEFYALAFNRKPEFMGFGQTEWVTPNRPTAYTAGDGEEAQARLAAYRALAARVQRVAERVPADRQSAFVELISYPVNGAALLNERILNLDLAQLYAREGRASANFYVDRARTAYARLREWTDRYNGLEAGKWRGMMDMAPRNLPVFQEPAWPSWVPGAASGCGISYGGQWFDDENTLTFTRGRAQTRVVTLFGYRPAAYPWKRAGGPASIATDIQAGVLDGNSGFEQRITLSYDGSAAMGDVTFTCGGKTMTVHTRMSPAADARAVSLSPAAASPSPDWQRLPGLGSMRDAARSRLDRPSVDADAAAQRPGLQFAFQTVAAGSAQIRVMTLPTHRFARSKGVRVLARLDNQTPVVLDLETINRSDQWRRNTLENRATGLVPVKWLPSGAHTLTLSAMDPGVVLDRIDIDLDGAVPHYDPANPTP